MAKKSLPKVYSLDNLVFASHPTRSNFNDLTGLQFGRWTVLGYAGNCDWFARCACGQIYKVRGSSLTRSDNPSRGCATCGGVGVLVHGYSKTRTHRIWKSMRSRCKPQYRQRQHYFDRGIAVCDRWQKFENFLEDMGECPTDKHSIDRIDNDKGYFPDNCRWATRTEQLRNTRLTIFLEVDGVRLSLRDWAEKLGSHHSLIDRRLRRGWSVEDALFKPLDVIRSNRNGRPYSK